MNKIKKIANKFFNKMKGIQNWKQLMNIETQPKAQS